MLKSWRKSLRGRLIVLTLSITVGTLLIFSGAMFAAELITLRNQKVTDSLILTNTISSSLSAAVAFDDTESANEILSALKSVPTVNQAWLIRNDNSLLAGFHRSNLTAELPDTLKELTVLADDEDPYDLDSSQITVSKAVTLDGDRIGTLILTASLHDINQRLITFSLAALIITLLASLIAYIFTSRLQAFISAPILTLATVAREVTLTRDYAARAPVHGNDEVGHLVNAFNEMLSEIQIRDQKLSEARGELEARVEQRTSELRNEMLVRKQAQDALLREQEQLRTLIKHAPVAIAMLDTKLNYVAHSDQWIKDFELPSTNVITKNHVKTIPNISPKWAEVYLEALSGTPYTALEDEHQLASGKKIHLRWTAQPWYRPNGTLGGVLKVAIVIDELIKARESAIRSAKLRTEFLTNVSHELRTPLNGIVGFTKLLMDPSTNAAESAEYIQIINYSAQLLSNLINDVLDFSKIESKKFQFEKILFDPTSVLKHCVDLFVGNAKIKNLPLRLELDSSIPSEVLGDSTRLQQIIVNLIGNAIKFTENGEITVRCKVKEKDSSRVTFEFAVQDTGIGIPDNKLNVIFEAFTQADGTITRQYGGSGLGLTIVRDLASGMGGKIVAESRLGEGSTFTLTIPFDIPESSDTHRSLDQSSDRTSEQTRNHLEILVAEDNKVNQKLIQIILQRNGHTVTLVDNGKQAVEAVKSKQFDLVLMDLQMPEMGGIEAATCIRNNEKLQNKSRRLPIIALTAHAFAEDQQHCADAQMDDYLTKPIDTKKLFETLQRLNTINQS